MTDFRPILTNSERDILNKIAPEGLFEVYSIATGEALSTQMMWTQVWDEFDRIAYGAGGACNGTDVRKHNPAQNDIKTLAHAFIL